MEMTNAEIYTSWREAKNKKDQVKILADLNCTTQEHIVEILKEQGADGRLLPRKRKPTETKEPPQETVAEPVKVVRPCKEALRPKPRVIHELERMTDLFMAILDAEKHGEASEQEYVEEFDELWAKYYGAKMGWKS